MSNSKRYSDIATMVDLLQGFLQRSDNKEQLATLEGINEVQNSHGCLKRQYMYCDMESLEEDVRKLLGDMEGTGKVAEIDAGQLTRILGDEMGEQELLLVMRVLSEMENGVEIDPSDSERIKEELDKVLFPQSTSSLFRILSTS